MQRMLHANRHAKRDGYGHGDSDRNGRIDVTELAAYVYAEDDMRALFREEVKPRLAKRPQVGASALVEVDVAALDPVVDVADLDRELAAQAEMPDPHGGGDDDEGDRKHGGGQA